jgi:hypothetical protein
MRRILKYLLPFAMLLNTSCDNDGNIENPDKKFFLKMYGTDGDQTAVDMEVLGDGSILLLGTSVSDDNTSRTYVVKLNDEGQIVWTKKFGETRETAVDIEPTLNGNFVLLSDFVSSNLDHDIKLILITQDGVKLDSTTRGSTNNEFPKSVTPLSDGGYIVTGKVEEVLNGPTNIFHFRCDSNLDWIATTWTDVYGIANKGTDVGIKVYQQDDTTFYVFGSSDQTHTGQTTRAANIFYYTLNRVGNTKNPHYTGKLDVDVQINSVYKAPGELAGNFVLLGTQLNASAPAGLQFSILRNPLSQTLDASGDEQIDTQLNLPATLTAVNVSAASSGQSATGYFILCNEPRAQGSNIYLAKIDQSANVLWSVSLGSESENDFGSVVRELPDGRILVLGTVRVADKQSKMALFKLNSNGRLQE